VGGVNIGARVGVEDSNSFHATNLGFGDLDSRLAHRSKGHPRELTSASRNLGMEHSSYV
jgi:hypothetical protein